MLYVSRKVFETAFVSVEIPAIADIIDGYVISTELMVLLVNDTRIRNTLNSAVRFIKTSEFVSNDLLTNFLELLHNCEMVAAFRYGVVRN